MLKITVDTNVLISSAIHCGNEFDILRAARQGKLKIVLSIEILDEFERVLRRPKFGFEEDQIERSIRWVRDICELVMCSEKIDVIWEDPSDNKILECAVCAGVDYIISGDRHLLRLKEFRGIPIFNAREFIEMVNDGKR